MFHFEMLIKTFKDIIIIIFTSFIFFTFLNFSFVYFSPKIIKLLPSNFVRSISPCYRTLFHHDGKKLEKSNFIFGDSYSEGAGEEFLNSDLEYGIFNKLKNSTNSEIIFGRGGYGNILTLKDFKLCMPLLSSYTSFPIKDIVDYDVTFVFYEGNDLNNNLSEEKIKIDTTFNRIRFFLPLFEFLFKEIRNLKITIYSQFLKKRLEKKQKNFFQVTSSGIKIPLYPQSAATELSEKELQKSMNLLINSLSVIKEVLPNAKNYRFLYLPSVTSSYDFKGNIRVQSYKKKKYYETTGEFNAYRSLQIRQNIEAQVITLNWFFCDTTQSLIDLTKQGLAIHGPKDWKHFNKLGYSEVAKIYTTCFLKK